MSKKSIKAVKPLLLRVLDQISALTWEADSWKNFLIFPLVIAKNSRAKLRRGDHNNAQWCACEITSKFCAIWCRPWIVHLPGLAEWDGQFQLKASFYEWGSEHNKTSRSMRPFDLGQLARSHVGYQAAPERSSLPMPHLVRSFWIHRSCVMRKSETLTNKAFVPNS